MRHRPPAARSRRRRARDPVAHRAAEPRRGHHGRRRGARRRTSADRRCSSTCRTRLPASRSTSTPTPRSRAISRQRSSAWSTTAGRGEHVEPGEENAPTHVRAALMGPSVRRPAPRRRLAGARHVAGHLLLRVRRAARPNRLRQRLASIVIEVEGLTKRYGSTLAVDDLSFSVTAGNGHRVPRAERRREVDDDARDSRPRASDVREDGRPRRAVPRARPSPSGASARCSRRSTRIRAGRDETTCACSRVAGGIPQSRVDEVLALVDLRECRPSAREGLLARHASAARSRRGAPRAIPRCSCSTSRRTASIRRASAGFATSSARSRARGGRS